MRKKEKKGNMPKVPKFNEIAEQKSNNNKMIPEKIPKIQEEKKKMDQFQELHKFLSEIKSDNNLPQKDQQKKKEGGTPIKKELKVASKISSSIEDKINQLYKKKLGETPTSDITKKTVPIIKKQEIPVQYLKSEDNEEYDPLQPNDYEEIKMKREKQEKQRKEKEAALAAQREQQEKQRKKSSQSDISLTTDNRTAKIDLKAEKYHQIDEEIKEAEKPQEKKKVSMDEKILNMMLKQGFKLGKGLGKNEQGILTPVIAEKITDSSARITQSSALMGNFIDQELLIRKKIIEELKLTPSTILLLRNMAGKQEADDTLRQEVQEECSHYGVVKNVIIYLMPTNIVEEQVRIFIEFNEEIESMKCYMDLDGRYFGGRVVKASFYDKNSFKQSKFYMPVK